MRALLMVMDLSSNVLHSEIVGWNISIHFLYNKTAILRREMHFTPFFRKHG